MKYTQIQCLFEQSGTFKSQFRRLRELAFDYDIENQFGKTDYICDLFEIINNNRLSDIIHQSSLTLAFFPCTYFSSISLLQLNKKNLNNINLTEEELRKKREKFFETRDLYYETFKKLIYYFNERNLPLIIENPYNNSQNFLYKKLKADYNLLPKFIDKDRRIRGDFFQKPTMFYFINFKPKELEFFTREMPIDLKNKKILKCYGIERSIISKEYAYNFIKEFVI